MSDVNWLTPYLRDHYAGASAGVQLFDRVASGHSDPEVRSAVAGLREDVARDKKALGSMMTAVGVPQLSVTMLLGMVGEYVGRLKPNGSLLQRSPGSDVLELEAMGAAVQGKSRVWETLLVLAQDDERLDAERLQGLLDRAHGQREQLIELHRSFLERLTAD